MKLWVALLLLSLPAHAAGRWALVIGENRGLLKEEQLRFAERDAARVRDVLVDVGGFESSRVRVLAGTDAAGVRTALQALKTELDREPVERLFLYVSSHASEGSLHLAGTELPLRELVDFLKSSGATVSVLVVDACQSGRLTNLKGLTPRNEPPSPPRLEASEVEGRVLIAASGANEFAQESDALQGSYFTHYLVGGLRGAADTSRDGKVTLQEAYEWAWARTIEATFSSRGGVQRPAFSVELKGAGQLVLSELQRSPTQLTLAIAAPGRWLIVDEATGRLYAELEKPKGPLTIAIPSGRYRVQLRLVDAVMERTITVPPEGTATISGDDLERAALLRVARKGGEETIWNLAVAGSISSGLVRGLNVEPGGEFRVRREGFLIGAFNQLTGSVVARGAAPVSDSFQHLELELRIGTGHRFQWTQGSLSLGVELGPLLALQWALPDASQRQSLALVTNLVLEGRYRLGGPFQLALLAHGGALVAKRLEGVSLIPRVGATLGLAVDLEGP